MRSSAAALLHWFTGSKVVDYVLLAMMIDQRRSTVVRYDTIEAAVVAVVVGFAAGEATRQNRAVILSWWPLCCVVLCCWL